MWLTWKLGVLLCCFYAVSSFSLKRFKRGTNYKVVMNHLPPEHAEIVASNLNPDEYDPTPGVSFHISHDSHSPDEVSEDTRKYSLPHGYLDREEQLYSFYDTAVPESRIVNHSPPEVIYSPAEMPYEKPEGTTQRTAHTVYSEEVQQPEFHDAKVLFQEEFYDTGSTQNEFEHEIGKLHSKESDDTYKSHVPKPENLKLEFTPFPGPTLVQEPPKSSLIDPDSDEDLYDSHSFEKEQDSEGFTPNEEYASSVFPEEPKKHKVRSYQPNLHYQPPPTRRPHMQPKPYNPYAQPKPQRPYMQPKPHHSHMQPQLQRPYMQPKPQRPVSNLLYNGPVPVAPHIQRKSNPISSGRFVTPIRSRLIMNDCTPIGRGHAIWTYHQECDGTPQSRWNVTYPMCGGDSQSPISINTKEVVTTVVPLIYFGYGHERSTQQVQIVNTGHGLEVNFRDNNDLILWGGKLRHGYKLSKIVFTSHALHPEDNLRHPLEVQFVYITMRSTYEEALYQRNGVVIVSFRITGSNPVPQEQLYAAGLSRQPISRQTEELIETLGYFIEVGSSLAPHQHQIRILYVQLKKFLVGLEEGAYAYKGSLPYPPCIEGVQWIVAKGVPAIPFHAMDQLTRKLHSMKNSVNLPITTNYRHTQPINDRKVELWISKSRTPSPYASPGGTRR